MMAGGGNNRAARGDAGEGAPEGVVGMQDGTAPVEPARGSGGHSWRSWRRLRGLVLPCAALVGLTWSWRHPEVLVASANYIEVNDVPGTTALIGMTVGDLGEETPAVTLRSARPRMVTPVPTGVTVDVWVCRDPVSGQPIFSARGSLQARCARVEQVHGAVLELSEETEEQLVLVVRSMGPHHLTISGLDVSYSAGWQQGHQSVGPTVVADFTGDEQYDAISSN
jgi:hypothetical protein